MRLLIALLCTLGCLLAARARQDVSQCAGQMRSWIAEQKKAFSSRKQDPHKMLYFLHVPRTAGRTTHNCFLMPMTPPSRRCAKSYDGIKYNISVPDCGLLSSHDDYSAMLQLPKFAAVYTSLRDPVQRVLSAYEFAVEVSSRKAVSLIERKKPDPKQGRVSTDNVWPWSYLVPFLEEDMLRRVRITLIGHSFH
jgi:protein-tyrosine sulfotransferase